MRHCRWWWIVLIELLPGVGLLFARSSASAVTIHHGLASLAGRLDRQPEADWADPGPVIRALTPEEFRRVRPLPSNSNRPVVRPEQKAVLLSPRNSDELVDELMAQDPQEMRRRAIAAGVTATTTYQVLGHPQRLTHSWLLPPGG